MTKKYLLPFLSLSAKTLFLSLILLLAYYFLFLRSRIEHSQKEARAEKVLTLHKDRLIQNRLAFLELTKLDPESANFDFEKSELVASLKKTNQEGLELSDQEKNLAKVDKKLSQRLPILLEETKGFYRKQKELLDKVFQTNSFQEGVTIMKSEQAVRLITRQTNLILEYDFWLKKIKEKQKSYLRGATFVSRAGEPRILAILA